MIALIDGDILAYRSACSCEDIPTLEELAAMGLDVDSREELITYEPIEVAYLRIDNLMADILSNTGSETYKVFISGDHDFRVLVNPEYKANRKDLRRPRYLQQCREYLITHWHGDITDGIEADDALGIYQTKYEKDGHESVVCSIDKDLLQIAGWNYNFVKKEMIYIPKDEANKFFWKQMLIGDKADNIIGVAGIGKVRADKLINPLIDDEDMYNTVYELYNDHKRFEMNYRCLEILTEELNG